MRFFAKRYRKTVTRKALRQPEPLYTLDGAEVAAAIRGGGW